LNLTPLVGSSVAALLDPALTKYRESFRGIPLKIRITPWAAAVINADRCIGLQLAGEILGGGELYLAHRNADLRVDATLDIDAGTCWKCVGALGLEGFFWGDHVKLGAGSWEIGVRKIEKATRGFAQRGLSLLPDPCQVQRVARISPGLSAIRLPRTYS
jgi:hypothetical protein